TPSRGSRPPPTPNTAIRCTSASCWRRHRRCGASTRSTCPCSSSTARATPTCRSARRSRPPRRCASERYRWTSCCSPTRVMSSRSCPTASSWATGWWSSAGGCSMTAHVTSEDTAAAGGLGEQLVAWRRHIHTHPDLSYEEHETTGYVDDELRALGLEPVRFRLGTGLWCDVPPADDADREDRVALRADIDALPMDEESGLD